ncbi:MAG: DUF2059 domain-containing protein [Verrucomicrobiota bacterium]
MKIVTTLLLTVLLSLPVYAEQTSLEKAAEEMLIASQTEKVLDQTVKQMEGMMDQTFIAAGLPESAKPEFDKAMKTQMEWLEDFLSWETMKPMYVEIYSSVYSEKELKAMTAFYSSEVGQKVIEKSPELIQKTMQVTMQRLGEKMPELQSKMQEAIVDLKKKFPESEEG